MRTEVTCPILFNISDLYGEQIPKDRDYVFYAKLSDVLRWMSATQPGNNRLFSYEYNRGEGKVSAKSKERVRNNYNPESFGTIRIGQNEDQLWCVADGHSRLAAVAELFAEGSLTRAQLDRLISINVTSDLIRTYIDTNAADKHTNKAKMLNPDMFVGALAVKIESLTPHGVLPLRKYPSFYTKLEHILIAYNEGWFKDENGNTTSDIFTKLKGFNNGDVVWRTELADLAATESPPFNLRIPLAFKDALTRYCDVRKALLTMVHPPADADGNVAESNAYAKDIVDSVGLMSVLVIDALTGGPISTECTVAQVVQRADFKPVIGSNPAVHEMYDIFCRCINNVSQTKKGLVETQKQWRNIERILTRSYLSRKVGGLEMW